MPSFQKQFIIISFTILSWSTISFTIYHPSIHLHVIYIIARVIRNISPYYAPHHHIIHHSFFYIATYRGRVIFMSPEFDAKLMHYDSGFQHLQFPDAIHDTLTRGNALLDATAVQPTSHSKYLWRKIQVYAAHMYSI